MPTRSATCGQMGVERQDLRRDRARPAQADPRPRRDRAGKRKYFDLNVLAMKLVEPGGCWSLARARGCSRPRILGPPRAARKAERPVQLLALTGAAGRPPRRPRHARRRLPQGRLAADGRSRWRVKTKFRPRNDRVRLVRSVHCKSRLRQSKGLRPRPVRIGRGRPPRTAGPVRIGRGRRTEPPPTNGPIRPGCRSRRLCPVPVSHPSVRRTQSLIQKGRRLFRQVGATRRMQEVYVHGSAPPYCP